MIGNIPEAFLSPQGGYTSHFDDGTNKFAQWVEVKGLPGVWPDGVHFAAVARLARGMNEMSHDIPYQSMDERANMVVRYVNNKDRITDPDAAHQAAHYEHVLRKFLPSAQESLIAAHGAVRAYQEAYGTPEEPSFKPGYLPRPLEVMTSRQAAHDRFADAVGPEVFAEGLRLSDAYRSAQNNLSEICTDINHRSGAAINDYKHGVDNTSAMQAGDYVKYDLGN